jgi:hypothetical protein
LFNIINNSYGHSKFETIVDIFKSHIQYFHDVSNTDWTNVANQMFFAI